LTIYISLTIIYIPRGPSYALTSSVREGKKTAEDMGPFSLFKKTNMVWKGGAFLAQRLGDGDVLILS